MQLRCLTQLATRLLSSFSNCNYVVGFCDTTCNYFVIFFFELQLPCLTQLATTLSSSHSNCKYGFSNTNCKYVVTVFFKLQLRCWPFLHNLQVGCYLLFQTANTLLVFATQLVTTLLSSFSKCNYVVGFRNTTCNYVPVFFFQLQHIATTLLAVVMQHATTLSSSFSNCNYVCNTTCNYVVIFFSNCNYVVGFSNTTCNYVVIFFFKLQLRCWFLKHSLQLRFRPLFETASTLSSNFN